MAGTMLRVLAAASLATVLATSEAALASSPPSPTDGAFVDIQPVALPIVVDGRMVNYVFVSMRLWARPGTDVGPLRLREPHFRDAMVRAAHRRSFAARGDATRVDEAALTAAVLTDARRLGGAVFQRAQVTSQTPQRRRVR